MTVKTKPVIKSLRIQNLLSFGENGAEVELEPLNVLIGPNGSGKSNFIEVLGLLQSAPTDLAEPIRNTGGISDWLWKGWRGCSDGARRRALRGHGIRRCLSAWADRPAEG